MSKEGRSNSVFEHCREGGELHSFEAFVKDYASEKSKAIGNATDGLLGSHVMRGLLKCSLLCTEVLTSPSKIL